jgi:hypothetical protein
MSPTVTRINPNGGVPDGQTDKMQVVQSSGNVVNVDIYDYIKFQKPDGTVVYGCVYGFSTYDRPDSFVYFVGPNQFGAPLTDSELDTLENLGKTKPAQMGGRRKNRRGTKRTRRNRRYSRKN